MKKNKIKVNRRTQTHISKLFIIYLLLSLALTLIIVGIGTHILISSDFEFTYGNIAIFLPILFVLNGVVIYVVFQNFFLHFSIFERGIEKIAGGMYNTRLSLERAGIFTTMIENFNQMAKELENRKSLNDDFVNNFSHEFKTPISSIQGFADLLLNEELSEEETKRYLQIIRDETYRLSSLSEKALFLSKINVQSKINEEVDYSLDEQIRECLILMERYIKEKKLIVKVDLNHVNYYSNPDIIKEVWINLLSNAIKYTNEDGEIVLKLKEIGGQIIFTIQDNGIGIDLEKQAYIFHEYYQADESHKSKGVGLGLSIVKKIIDLASGTIEVFSEPNKGTTFIVKLKQK